MKVLKTALIVIFIGILVYFIIGLLTPPVSKKVTLELKQSAEEVFATLTNQSNMTQWVPGLKSVLQVSGKPNTIGSVAEFVFVRDSLEIPILVRINDYKENESMNLTLIHDKLISDVQIKFLLQNNGSKLDVSYKITGNSLLTKTAMPFIKPLIEKYSDMDIEELKTLLQKS
ncbi:MAG: SRPBCC family protein [Candidatus Neomarinimicrobiota bacterium]